MSRAGAAQSGPTAAPTSASNTFLALRENPTGLSTALVRSEPFGCNSIPVDVGALVMLTGLLEYSNLERIGNRRKYLESEQSKRKKKFADYQDFTSHGGGIFKITSYLVFTRILDFLLHRNAFQSVPLVIAPEHFPIIDDQLNDLQMRLQNAAKSTTANFELNFFSKNYQAGFEFACLLDAALNADLKMVERILAQVSPEQRRAMLSTVGKATITHLDIERTGTPLQMAIYDHDEEMVAFFKEHMDPAEFQHQWEAVLGSDYQAFLAKQEIEAETLCNELKGAFEKARPNEITCDTNYAAKTTSTALQDTLGRFRNKLEQYIKDNPIHNPYILQQVYNIYVQLPDNFESDCLFSQQVIGFVQSKMSARWLQHYAQGIYYLAENNEAQRRSFNWRDSRPVVDIRNLVSSGDVGRDSFLSIFGAVWSPRFHAWWSRRNGNVGRVSACYKTFVEQKQQTWRAYAEAVSSRATENSCSCVVQ